MRKRRGESGGCTQDVELLTCRRGGSLVREEWLARTFSRSFAWRTRRCFVVEAERRKESAIRSLIDKAIHKDFIPIYVLNFLSATTI